MLFRLPFYSWREKVLVISLIGCYYGCRSFQFLPVSHPIFLLNFFRPLMRYSVCSLSALSTRIFSVSWYSLSLVSFVTSSLQKNIFSVRRVFTLLRKYDVKTFVGRLTICLHRKIHHSLLSPRSYSAHHIALSFVHKSNKNIIYYCDLQQQCCVIIFSVPVSSFLLLLLLLLLLLVVVVVVLLLLLLLLLHQWVSPTSCSSTSSCSSSSSTVVAK